VTPATHTTANFENWWRNLGSGMGNPPVGGYHEVILANGDVEINYNPTQISHGVASQNDDSYHICVVGDFRVNGAQPNANQMRTLLDRIRFNVNRFTNVTFDRVLGHNEFPGNASNICPGMRMSDIRGQAREVTPATNATTHTVRSGETLSGIALQHRTTVAELTRLNNITNANLIRVGQVLRLPGNASNTPSITELARQVIAGQWGSGQDRVNRLTRAGHNAATVQQEVNRLLR
jgi:hypothetical protein